MISLIIDIGLLCDAVMGTDSRSISLGKGMVLLIKPLLLILKNYMCTFAIVLTVFDMGGMLLIKLLNSSLHFTT